jgi:uncharacterized damage-inducible protein DinB
MTASREDDGMKRILTLACALVLVSAIPALAQKAIADVLARSAQGTFVNLVESAEKMPEADYSFQATKETRTFAGFVGHTINSAYAGCARAKGEPNPNKENLETVTSKAKLVEAAKAVQTYCNAVYAAQTDASLAEMIPQGQNQVARAQALIGIISHNMNEYGQMVILMRLKGHVPPTTERMQRKPGQD